jgi:Sulfotransferase family
VACRPLFFVGNKRSGTSYLVRKVNIFPNVFVCPEADLVWLLFLAENGQSPRPYPRDGDRGMLATLALSGDTLNLQLSVRERFFQMAYRFRVAAGFLEPDLQHIEWLGDKKPVQSADPMIRSFLYYNFPDARCIHLVRHPAAVVNSMIDHAKDSMPWMECWKQPYEELLRRWCEHERWVMDMKQEKQLPILTIAYSDLIEQPKTTIAGLANFLEVPVSRSSVAAASATIVDGNTKYRSVRQILNREAEDIVNVYGLRL